MVSAERFGPERLSTAGRGEVEGRACEGLCKAVGVAHCWPEEVLE